MRFSIWDTLIIRYKLFLPFSCWPVVGGNRSFKGSSCCSWPLGLRNSTDGKRPWDPFWRCHLICIWLCNNCHLHHPDLAMWSPKCTNSLISFTLLAVPILLRSWIFFSLGQASQITITMTLCGVTSCKGLLRIDFGGICSVRIGLDTW